MTYFYEENYLTLTVIDDIHNNPHCYGYGGPMTGSVRPNLEWMIEKRKGVIT